MKKRVQPRWPRPRENTVTGLVPEAITFPSAKADPLALGY